MQILMEYMPVIIAAVVLFVFWFVLRSKATKFESLDGLKGRIGSGKPVVLEFFANF